MYKQDIVHGIAMTRMNEHWLWEIPIAALMFYHNQLIPVSQKVISECSAQ